MSAKKKIFIIFAALVIIGASFSIGAAFGYSRRAEIEKIPWISGKVQPNDVTVDFEPFWKVWRLVEDKYGLPEKVDRQEMVWGAINGLLKPLDDPYTTFFPPVQKELFESGVRGNFGGVGMEVSIKDGFLTVVAPLKGTPAFAAGIKTGDKILKIEDKETTNMTVEEAVTLIRGPKGTPVNLTIISEGEDKPRVLSVVRDTIQIPVLETEKIGSDVFVIRLHNFSERSAFEFQKALRDFVFSNADKLVIDLRGNPGGYLESAVDMASWFLEVGKPVLREKYRDGSENVHKSKGYNAFPNFPLVILVDGGSASASEILAGALHDNGKAKLVGEKTFGKGSVQEVVPITGDTSLKITIARWLTPNGVDITKAGIKPDFEVKMTSEDLKQKKDPQMDKALEILKGWPKQ
ncbi:S41 family peptidase [Candidatus Giovannonibacteria bacterium]|nr:S41 family peptidase [Candidatus Giovannonibacteria bacterium]